MENEKGNITLKYILPLFLIAVIGVFTVFAVSPNSTSDSDLTVSSLTYKANVCNTVTRADGTVEDLGCTHNIVTNDGLDHIKGQLANGWNSTAFSYIALCNASAACGPVDATSTTLENEYVGSGLTRVAGTYGTLGTGNWTYWTTFTSAENNILTNKTGIFNSSLTGDTLLAENVFSLVTLQASDQLTVNWTITVTNPA